MTVNELMDALDEYGGHLQVFVRIGYGNDDEKVISDFEVTDVSSPDHDGVVIDA